jgi:WD40 repeat protein
MQFRSAHAWRNIHRSFSCPAGIKALAVSPDGTRVAAGNWRGEITVWDLSTTRVLRSWQAYDAKDGNVGQLIFSPDSRSLLVEVDYWHLISIWNLDTGAQTASIEGHALSFESAAGSGPPVVWLDQGGEIRVHRADGTLIRTIPHPGVPLGAHGEILRLPGAHFQKWTPQTGAVDYLLTITLQHPAAPDWIVTHPGTAVYSSSESGDEHAYLRLGPYRSNLRRYRSQFRRD